MTAIIEDKQKAIEYHRALIRYSQACIAAIIRGVDITRVNNHSLPVNVLSPRLIDQYTNCVKKEPPCERDADEED